MMLFKLPFRNIKNSIKSYMVYFATLILGVAIFYVFNAIETQSAMLTIKDNTLEFIELIVSCLEIVSVFVAFVLGFLIVYASTFMMKRRKKEFAIYMLLGMSKQSISAVLVIETILVGIISLGVGLVVGIIASQGMSIIVANLFEADMTSFKFVISNAAILKTLIYFAVMYVLVIIFDVFVVGKAKLINLITAGRKSEKNYAKNPIVCAIVFVIACILLGTAYYKVTAGVEAISDLADLGKQIVKGIIGTFMMFWSVSGTLLMIVKKSKRFYYKGINCFSTKELSNRINSNVFSGGIICLLLFFTICGLSCSIAVKNSANELLRRNVQADVEIMYSMALGDDADKMTIADMLKTNGVDMSGFDKMTEVNFYYSDVITSGMFSNSDMAGDKGGFLLELMTISDYNKVLDVFGKAPEQLDEDQFLLVANYSYSVAAFKDSLKGGCTINICGRDYTTKYDHYINAAVHVENTDSNRGVLVVPDSCDFAGHIDDFFDKSTSFFANYANIGEAEQKSLDEKLSSMEFSDRINSNEYMPYINITTRSLLYSDSIGISALCVFLGTYLGVVFLITAAAMLSLKELSGAADNKDKYAILRKIGVDENMINRSLFGQSLMFFLLPLLLAIVHSIFGIQTGLFILQTFSKYGLAGAIVFAGAVILAIYMIYFVVTYLCSKEIIKDNK